VNDADRASDVVDRIGSLIKKAPARKEVVDLNAAILEVTALTHRSLSYPAARTRSSNHVHGNECCDGRATPGDFRQSGVTTVIASSPCFGYGT
jgi:hypothetical protein